MLIAFLLLAFTLDSLNLPEIFSGNHPVVYSSDDLDLAGAANHPAPNGHRHHRHTSILPRGGTTSGPVLEQTILVDEDSPVQVNPDAITDLVSREPALTHLITADPALPSAPIYLRLGALLI